MSMKKYLFLILLLNIVLNSRAQNFIHVANDIQGDPTQLISPDAKALAYMLTSDSILFKIDFYERIDNKEWNISFGLDTNLNVNDGALWEGSNTSMNYDLLFKLFFNPGFPPISGYVIDASQMNATFLYSAVITDTATLVAGLKLSDYNLNKPLQFIAGTGIVLGDINDDIPDNTYFSIPTNINKAYKNYSDLKFFVHPNPSKQFINIEFTAKTDRDNYNYEISDTKGVVILSGHLDTSQPFINIGSISKNIYLLRVFNEAGSWNLKFQKD